MEQAGHRGSRPRSSMAVLAAALTLALAPVAAGASPPDPPPLPVESAAAELSIGAVVGRTQLAAAATRPAVRMSAAKATTPIATSPTTSTTSTTSTTTTVSATTTVVTAGTMLFPMAPVPKCDILDSFGDSRPGGTHQGVDILATLGQQVYAVADGTLTKQYLDGTVDGRLAGNGWRETLPDGTTYAYLHLSSFAAGLAEGSTVRRGELIGYVGDTGNPGPGNYHLHFEYHPRGGAAVDPLRLFAIPAGCNVY